ncbi:MAG: metallophosphoesterase [Streptococcaceae bacterium]|jgi:serine/threonine protein phosphatase 1|nr:metallophosphoesterase [Streptococcaceae bacterium]
MKENVYVISDIHGMEDLFEEALEKWNKKTMQLILIGDLADRGPKGKQCFYKAMKLAKEKGAIYLTGNHEEMFLNFLSNPEERFHMYSINGGIETLESFFFKGVDKEYSPTEMAMMIKSQHKELIRFLGELPLYYEWKEYIFVHAGVNLLFRDWKYSTKQDFVWIREPFFKLPNQTGKIIVFGHTPTPLLHEENGNFDLWLHDNKIGIDGGGVYGGAVHGVLFKENGEMIDNKFNNQTNPWQPRY